MRRRRPPAAEETAVIRHEHTAELDRPAAPPPGPGRAPGPPPGWLRAENPWPWLLLILVAVAGLLIWLFLFRGSSDRATVPRVVGLTQQAAIARLNEQGFDVTAVRRPAKAPANRVASQTPGAGSQLKRGQKVQIVVSTGTPPANGAAPPPTTTTTQQTQSATMPDATGQSLAVAGAAVEGAGLVPDSYPVSSAKPSGTVVSQDPSAGASVEQGANVRLNVSKGAQGDQPAVDVPDVKGLKGAEALAKLWAAKLTARTLARSSSQKGVVVEQQPGPGQAPAYSQITLYAGH